MANDNIPTLIDLTNINNQVSSAVTNINANSAAIETAFANTLPLDGSGSMEGNLDMNSNRILNLPSAINTSEPATYGQLLASAAGTLTFTGLTAGNNLSDVSNLETARDNLGFYATLAVAKASTINSNITWVKTGGYTTIGDGGDSMYYRVNSAPAHAGKFQDLSNQWWELLCFKPNPLVFGAVPNLSDSTSMSANVTAIQNMVIYATTYLNTDAIYGGVKQSSSVICDGLGLFYYVNGTISLNGSGLEFSNFYLKVGAQGNLTDQNAVLTYTSGNGLLLRQVYIDCGGLNSYSCTGIYLTQPGFVRLEHCTVEYWYGTYGNGLWMDVNASPVVYDCVFGQWHSSATQAAYPQYRSGSCIKNTNSSGQTSTFFATQCNNGAYQINSSATSTGTMLVEGGVLLNSYIGNTCTITIASPGVVTVTGHKYVLNDIVVLKTTGALPTGLATSTNYYVVSPSTNTFELATSASGTPIVTTGSQSGVQTVQAVVTNAQTVSIAGVARFHDVEMWDSAIIVVASSSNTAPDVQISDMYWYDSSPTILPPALVQVTTSYTGTYLTLFKLGGTQRAQSSFVLNLLNLAVTGSGSYIGFSTAQVAAINAIATEDIITTRSGLYVLGGFNTPDGGGTNLGGGALTYFTWGITTLSASTHTFAAADSGTTFLCTSGSTQTFTLPNSLLPGFTVQIIAEGGGTIAMTAATGAFINGSSAGTVDATAAKLTLLMVGRNSGGSAAEWFTNL